MIKGLYRRLALVLVSVFLVLGIVLFQIYENAGQRLQQETSQQLHLKLASYLVQEIDLFTDGELDQNRAKEAFSKVMMIGPGTELYIIGPEGEVLAYEAPDEKIIQKQIAVAPIKEFINSDNAETLPILGDDPRSLKQKVFSAAPILDQNKALDAYLYIIIRGEIYDTVATMLSVNKSWWLSLSMVVAALAFLLLTTLLLFYKFTRPLVRLKREVAAFEQSGFQQLGSFATLEQGQIAGEGDELQQLRHSFARMSRKIVEQLHYLQKHDQIRREFLAHVSHDLRTPLAGMRAYLETLQLKGDKLSEKERDDFLKKALLTNKQLTGMITELFELARLEHGQIEIHRETVHISDLLSDMYASLSGMANDKGIHLEVSMEDEQAQVFADVAKLERVLQNLISNAIVYTPTGGTVTISVNQDNTRHIRLSVADTGQGIPADELPHVFEPYFRSTNAKARFHEGKGLGLAISAGLLALHGSELTVDSQLGQGSIFSFRLPS